VYGLFCFYQALATRDKGETLVSFEGSIGFNLTVHVWLFSDAVGAHVIEPPRRRRRLEAVTAGCVPGKAGGAMPMVHPAYAVPLSARAVRPEGSAMSEQKSESRERNDCRALGFDGVLKVPSKEPLSFPWT